jgi:hypothetical protein
MAKSALAYLGYALALIGGILLILFGGLTFLGMTFPFPFQSPLQSLNLLGRDLITVMLGIISIVASKQMRRLDARVVLIIVGCLGGGLGGLLVLAGGILGLISFFAKRA